MSQAIRHLDKAMNTHNKQSGFTLIEVMVVIVILGVLAALIVPNVMGRGEKAKVDTTEITLSGTAGALDQYKLDNGRYPSMQDGGLEALIKQPASAKNWMQGGYVKGGYPTDSWIALDDYLSDYRIKDEEAQGR